MKEEGRREMAQESRHCSGASPQARRALVLERQH